MHRLLTLCLAAALLSLSASVQAAGPAPRILYATPASQVIYDNTVVVMHFDIEAATPQSITAMFDAVAPQAKEDIAQMRDNLITKRNELAELGVTDLTMSVYTEGKGDVPMMAARLGDNADSAKVTEWIVANGPTRNMVTIADNDMVIGWPSSQKVTGEPSQAAADRLAAATKVVGNGPFVIAFLPNEKLRGLIQQESENARGQKKMMAMMAVTAAKANWIIGTIQPGPTPSVRIIADMPDPASAEQLSNLWMGSVRIGQQLMMAMASRGGGDVPDLEPVVQALTPKVEDARATVTIDTPTAKTIATTALPGIISARKTAQRAVLLSNMRQATIGIITYTVDYGGQFPPTLDAVVKGGYIDEAGWKKIIKHPTGGYSPAFVYVKPDVARLGQLQNPTETAILIEADKDGKPKKDGIAAYADGHVATPDPE